MRSVGGYNDYPQSDPILLDTMRGGIMTREMIAASSLITSAELERLSPRDKQVELVRGRLIVVEPPGSWHGRISARLALRVGEYAQRRELGDIFAQDTGFKIASNPDTVRAPDMAFVARDRMGSIARRGYAELAPDLVVEVLSLDDRPGDVLAKIADWLDAGTRLVWVIDPDRLEARVHRRDGSLSLLGRHASLDGKDVLPGFSCPLRDILE